MTDLENLNIKLTQEERAALRGKQGPTMQKVMKTVVLYGEALGAERLVDIEGDGHFVITYAIPGIAPSMEMLDELVASGLKAKHPFTLDPKPPLDFENWHLSSEQVQVLEQMYRDQARYDESDFRQFGPGCENQPQWGDHGPSVWHRRKSTLSGSPD